ncbi:MAG: hypothetical protein JF599_06610 [Verrucomicrobia bacterium]|nr:hypothetical protein [Verrucomicrobiota bacterium]
MRVKTLKIDKAHQLAPDFHARAASIRLSAGEWKIVLALDGEKTFRSICTARELDEPSATRLLQRLRRLGLVVESQLSLAEYLSQNGGIPSPGSLAPFAPAAPVVAAAAPVVVATIPAPVAPKIAPEIVTLSIGETTEIVIGSRPPFPQVAPIEFSMGSVTSTHAVEFSLGSATTGTPPPEPAVEVSFSPDFPEEASEPAEERPPGLHLKSVINFIVQHAGGGTVGQLAVYRVFLRVPAALLQAANIRSLKMVDESLTLHSPELIAAVLRAVRETLHVEYEPAGAALANLA